MNSVIMPEFSARSPKVVPLLFAAVCSLAVASLIYFARSAVLQAVPAYSTLNAGPDGAKLLFDSLKKAGFVGVSRQFKSIALERPNAATVFFLGVDPNDLAFASRDYFDEMEMCASAGNRLVIAVSDSEVVDLAAIKANLPHELADRWGIRFVSRREKHTSSISPDKKWTALPVYGGEIWRRDFGKGSIVLVGNTQLLSNRQIATKDASRQLLLGLVDSYRSAVFEEAHLGIRESGSIVGLARHYHLQGLLAGLLLLGALFVWSRSVNFPPALATQDETWLGSDTRSMLTELMSRHLKKQLIAACVAEWNRTRAHAPALTIPEESNAVTAYGKLQQSLQEKTRYKL